MCKPHGITILLPNLRGGGAERVAVNLANGFDQRGFAVDIVLLSATGEFLVDLRPSIRIIDLQVKRMRGVLLPLVRYFIHRRPDTVLACMWPLTVIAIWASRLAHASTRVVVAEHTTWSRDEIASSAFGRWKVSTTMHHTFTCAYGIVAVSQGAADDLSRFAKLDRNAITSIYNPVVGEERLHGNLPLEPANWWSGTHRRVLAVGALKAIKDYATLLAAFAKLCKRVDARLLILGEGECRIELEAQVKHLGLESSVFMPGFVKDLTSYYQHADLHVLSSTGEGFGNVIVEALASGTPVVSTDCPSGPNEILCNGKFGRLVPVGDPTALAEAMAESLAATHDHAALKARAQDFSIDKAVDQYVDILFPNAIAKVNK